MVDTVAVRHIAASGAGIFHTLGRTDGGVLVAPFLMAL